jgi:hypothetical protein
MSFIFCDGKNGWWVAVTVVSVVWVGTVSLVEKCRMFVSLMN